MSPRTAHHRGRGAVALAGGLLFAVSLLVFADSYARRFGVGAVSGGGATAPVLVNVALFSVFALHHSVFARAGIKARLIALIPAALERSSYVWLASLLFLAVCVLWRPVPGTLWHTDGWGAAALRAIQIGAAGFTLIAARHLDMLELAGVRQAVGLPRRHATGLDAHGPYGLVRHPIYLAWMGMVWAAPTMTGTHLTFAALSTAYLLIAIPLEERDLKRTFGAAYDAYARRVKRKLIPGVY